VPNRRHPWKHAWARDGLRLAQDFTACAAHLGGRLAAGQLVRFSNTWRSPRTGGAEHPKLIRPLIVPNRRHPWSRQSQVRVLPLTPANLALISSIPLFVFLLFTMILLSQIRACDFVMLPEIELNLSVHTKLS
jgi:hypothetical protein